MIGDLAGPDLGNGGDNIYIGAGAGTGVGDESQTIRIGEPGFIAACFIAGISGVAVSGDPVCVDGDGQLGECGAGLASLDERGGERASGRAAIEGYD